MVTGKWTTLTRNCNKFVAIVDAHARLSGENDSMWLARCYKTFAKTWGFAFIHYEAWDVLKNQHKWRGVKADVPKKHVRIATGTLKSRTSYFKTTQYHVLPASQGLARVKIRLVPIGGIIFDVRRSFQGNGPRRVTD
ncbi:hypothetical protein Tco_1420114 [Tanacetum coccineum]